MSRHPRGTGQWRTWHRLAAAAVAGVMAGALAGPVTAPASPASSAGPVRPSAAPAVTAVRTLTPTYAKPHDDSTPYRATATRWPAAASATVKLGPSAGRVRGAGVPVWAQTDAGYRGPDTLELHVADHSLAQAAGVSGVLLQVTPGAGGGSDTARLGIDYSDFAQASGGNFAARLRLVRLPACAATTPSVAACRVQTPLPSSNDLAAHTVSALVSLTGGAAGLVVAATTDPGTQGGAAGSYAATSLKPSGSWAQGGNSGSFTYNYPITVPPAASDLIPDISLSYDSGSVDGQTAGSGVQSSWVGDGWSTPESYVEQSFVSCSDSPEGTASPKSTSDMCYDGPVLTMSLNGSSTSLVWDAGKQVWKAQDDTGEVITHVTNSGNGTGTYNTDYWKLTERDGTSYWFGLNHLPGWGSGKPATNSVNSEPVYSAHQPNGTTLTDPCWNSAGFDSSVCTMAWQWNLDYVRDMHGNAMAYYYHQDTNFYGRNNQATTDSYTRDSYLDHIDYGFTDGHAYTAAAPDQVVFHADPRCLTSGCSPLSASTKANWPDVPYDLYCPTSSSCSNLPTGPSFFSTARLTSITTRQYTVAADGSRAYQPIDTYALAQSMPATADGLTSPTLWLDTITHTGQDLSGGGSSASISLPAVSFGKTNLQNRVDTSSPYGGMPGLYRYRITSVTTETGETITVTYGLPNTCASPVKLDPATNTSSCYPVYWTPQGATDPYRDWFEKYVVTQVTEHDSTGGAPDLVTAYQYPGGAAWHFDDNEVVKAKYRSYGQFRGYGTVNTFTGDSAIDKRSQSQTTYYRGMSKDNNATTVNVTDSAGGRHEDLNQLSGKPLEQTAFLGENGPVDHSTISSYWVSAATATRTRTGLPALTANWTATAETYTRQAVTSTGTTTWRYTETDTSYDATTTDGTVGLPIRSYTHTVPTDPAYDSCATTAYAAVNTAANLVGLVAEQETDSVACGGFTEGSPASVPAALNTLAAPAPVNRPGQVVSDTRTFYDDTQFGTTFPQASPPSKGDATMTRKAADYSGSAFVYQTTARSAYDTFGRVTTAYDGNGNATTTAYTMSSIGLTVGTTVTNPLQQHTSTTLDPTRGLTLTSTDPNGVLTTSRYDALGRVTAVWLHSRTAPAPANYLYSYLVQNSGPSGLTAVTTQTLTDGGGYRPLITIYDALLRPRQTQTSPHGNGRILTDTFYDSRGWKRASFNAWWDPNNPPATNLVTPAGLNPAAHVTDEDFYTYDGLGRVVLDNSARDGAVISATVAVYTGDATTVIPNTSYNGQSTMPVPNTGGITQTTKVDPLGRTTELDQYTTSPTLNTPADTFTGLWTVTGGTLATTRYGYDGHGNQATVTDAAANTWVSGFNLLGQVTTKTDPDAGASTMKYDGDGNLTQTIDARSKTISYTYDPLSRKTGQYDAPAAQQADSNRLASWVYDNTNNIAGVTYPVGHLTAETAYRDGATYTSQITGFNIFGEPLGQTVTIPNQAGTGLAGSYTFTHTYTTLTGLPAQDGYPAAGGLAAETVNHGYKADGYDSPNTVNGLVGILGAPYVANIDYDAFGRVTDETLGGGTSKAHIVNGYDDHTGRLTDQTITRTTTPTTVDDQKYTYDLAGNITRQVSTRLGAATPTETQCYQYDPLARLTQAWSATDACTTVPTGQNHSTVGDSLGSASAYWTSWQLDDFGQRITQTQHNLTGTAADATTAYTYNGNGTNQPHTLTATTTAGGATTGTSYTYDKAGNTVTRNSPAQGGQSLAWNDLNQLTAVTGSTAGDTSYLYDPDGNLLLENGPNSSTLYLPGEQVTHSTTTGTTSGTRYYPLPGGGTAVRTGTPNTAYQFEITDQRGTPTLYLDHTAQQPSWRQYTPYGQPRGITNTWPDNHGFLNKPTNASTGLNQIGARNYDPDTGRFISLDPVFNPNDPQQLNGYSYTAANPITQADPTGMAPTGCGGMGHSNDKDCIAGSGDGGGGGGDPAGGEHSGGNHGDHGGGGAGCGRAGHSHDSDCKTTPDPGRVVHISPHVAIHENDPRYKLLTELYEGNSGWHCLWLCSETQIWSTICLYTMSGDMCPAGLKSEIESADPFGEDNPVGGQAATTVIGPGNVFRNLADPNSMIGVTEAEVQAMLPASWTSGPVNTGAGTKWMSPNNGRYGSIRYQRGGSPQVNDPLHRGGDYLNVRIGGMQYRVAAQGNAVIGDPNIPSVQILPGGGGPMGPLEPRPRAPRFAEEPPIFPGE